MNKVLLVIFFTVVLVSKSTFSQSSSNNNQRAVYDTIFNEIVPDPMRWLENTTSNETKNWVNTQDSIYKDFLKTINKELTITGNYIEKYKQISYNAPVKKGDFYFFIYYNEFDNYYDLYMSREKQFDFTTAYIVFSPKSISKTDNIELRDYQISKDSRYLSVCFSRNGSDLNEITIIDLKKMKALAETISNVFYSSMVWLQDGFFYNTYEVSEKFAAVKNASLYYHRINTPQSEDILIFKKRKGISTFDYINHNKDSAIILKEISEEKNIYNLYKIAIDSANKKTIVTPLSINTPMSKNINIVGYKENTIYGIMNINSFNGVLAAINTNDISKITIIGKEFNDAVLLNTIMLNDTTFISRYRKYNQTEIVVKSNQDGEVLKAVDFQAGFTISNMYVAGNEIQITTTFPVLPPVVYSLDIESFKMKIYDASSVTFDYKGFTFYIKNYRSEDNVEIPMLIIHKKSLNLDGNNPALLEVYGGFGATKTHYFNPGLVHFISSGGIYAYAYIRGNGDLGDNWWMSARRLNKTKSINDIIAGANYLINNNYTKNSKLALTGGSNGGMLTAAAMIKNPNLFKLVVPLMGVYDMLRFENSTVGPFHIDEFGTVKNKEDFNNLISYSPYHNIDTTINYPNVIVYCSENDDRVTPWQSYKFVARLQSNPAQKNKVLLVNQKNAGHYGSILKKDNLKNIEQEYTSILHILNY
jgi:prolyl oligopeptidase